MKKVLIAPSILSCNFLCLGREIKAVEDAGANLIHVDVMDGHFVPNITFGPLIVSAIREATSLPIDVHLMIEEPRRYIKDFAQAGADFITIHIETDAHALRTIETIKKEGKKAGVSLNPSTPVYAAEYVIPEIDLLLIMTVNPGFGGQSYIPSMEEKIRKARTLIDEMGREIYLEVDGGINADNARTVVEAGSTILVMGTEIFKSKNYKRKIQEIRRIIDEKTFP